MNTYSPDGKLFQVDYAYKAIENSGYVRRRCFSKEFICPFKPLLRCSTAVGVRCRDGVILGVEKLIASKLLTPGSGRRLHTVDDHIGVVSTVRNLASVLSVDTTCACVVQAVAGLMPDARQLVSRARDESSAYRRTYGEAITPQLLNDVRATKCLL